MASEANRLATLAYLRNKIAACEPGSSMYNYYLKQYKSFGGTVNGAAASDDFSEPNNNSWMIVQTQQLAKNSNYVTAGITEASTNISSSISNKGDEILAGVQGWKQTLSKTLEPVSTAMGSHVDTATAIVKNPLLAPQLLGNSLIQLVDKVNPNFTNEMDGAFKSVNLDNLQHLPSNVMGSVRNLATAADAILSVPFQITSDIYNGLMEILDAIGDLIDKMMSAVMDFIFGPQGLLDNILPMSELMDFFDAVAEMASFVGNISQQVGGFTAITDIAGQVGNYASSASSILSNPEQLALSYIPQQATDAYSQGMGFLRNPEQYLQSALPPEISKQMQNISQIPGFGFVGNYGFSIGDTLDTLSNGVFETALDKFSDKAGFLGPLFNKQAPPPDVDNQENYSDTFEQPKVGVNPTAQGIPVPNQGDSSSYKVLPETSQPELNVQNLNKSPSTSLLGAVQEKPWLTKTPVESGTGPTIKNAANIKPSTISATMPAEDITYGISGGSVTIPSSFNLSPR